MIEMRTGRRLAAWAGTCALSLLAVTAQATDGIRLNAQQQLGRALFFDRTLSIDGNQACAVCHAPVAGWTGPRSRINAEGSVYEGSIRGRFGNRKPPSAAYATSAPIFHMLVEDGAALFVGGNFWDGRATGEKLGNPAADQAQGPFLNPLEQALSDPGCVIWKACGQPYAGLLRRVVPGSCEIAWPPHIRRQCASGQPVPLAPAERDKVSAAYDGIARAIAAYEASPEVNAYSSKFDAWQAGRAHFTRLEQAGFRIFNGKAQCAACHPVARGPNGEAPMLTDFTFDNLGVPGNPDNPWYEQPFNPQGAAWVDEGLAGFLARRTDYQAFALESRGKQKVPTLRNVDQRPNRQFVKAYMHNGYFKTLEGVVNFYNTRDTKPRCPDPLTREADALAQGCWPVPEVAENVNVDELGNLGLAPWQERALVAFLKTLSDGWTPDQ